MSEIPWPLLTQPLDAQAPPKVEQDGAPLERLLAAESAIEASRDEITAASSVEDVETAARNACKNFKEWLGSVDDMPVKDMPVHPPTPPTP